MKYRIGETIVIKSLEEIEQYARNHNFNISCCYSKNIYNFYPLKKCSLGFVDEMKKYCNRETKIIEIREDGTYQLDIDKGYWIWIEWMIKKHPLTNLLKNIMIKIII